MRNPRINLLPYRDQVKKAIKVRYLSFLGVSFVLGLIIMGLVHSYFGLQITTQEARNQILEKDIAALDKQNEEIKKLRQEIAAAVARKQVVESLQANRSRAVMILNQVVQPPANIFYRSIRQTGDLLTLTGYAPSNTSVSALIKQLETSDILFDPKLVESKAVNLETGPLIEFSMTAKIVDLAKIAGEKNKPKQAPTPRPEPTSDINTVKPAIVPPSVSTPANPSSPTAVQPAGK